MHPQNVFSVKYEIKKCLKHKILYKVYFLLFYFIIYIFIFICIFEYHIITYHISLPPQHLPDPAHLPTHTNSCPFSLLTTNKQTKSHGIQCLLADDF